jgi:hypothetical protein
LQRTRVQFPKNSLQDDHPIEQILSPPYLEFFFHRIIISWTALNFESNHSRSATHLGFIFSVSSTISSNFTIFISSSSSRISKSHVLTG